MQIKHFKIHRYFVQDFNFMNCVMFFIAIMLKVIFLLKNKILCCSQREHLKIAQQYFQLVGGSASECGTQTCDWCSACHCVVNMLTDVAGTIVLLMEVIKTTKIDMRAMFCREVLHWSCKPNKCKSRNILHKLCRLLDGLKHLN